MVSWGLSKSWFLRIQKWLQGFWWSKVFDDPEMLRLVGLSMSWCPNGILLLKRAPISLGPNSRAIHVWNILKLACRSKQHIMLFYTFKVLNWNLSGQVIGSAVARRASFRTASHFPTRLGGPTCFSFLQPFWRCLSPSGDSGMHYDWGNNADMMGRCEWSFKAKRSDCGCNKSSDKGTSVKMLQSGAKIQPAEAATSFLHHSSNKQLVLGSCSTPKLGFIPKSLVPLNSKRF